MFNVLIERDGDGIVIDQTVAFEESDVDVAGLELCSIPVTCAELTAQPVPTTIEGTLEAGDIEVAGSWWDLYAFTVDNTTTVRIDMTSEFFDTSLTLFDASGEFIAQNDDFVDTDSRVTRTLPEGCYVVLATSYGPSTGGAYTLTFSQP